MAIEQDGVGEPGTPPPTHTLAPTRPLGALGGAFWPLVTTGTLLILGAYAALGILLSMLLCALKPRPKSG